MWQKIILTISSRDKLLCSNIEPEGGSRGVQTGERRGFGLTHCGRTECHDSVEGERSSLKLHVLITSLHLYSTLIRKRDTNTSVNCRSVSGEASNGRSHILMKASFGIIGKLESEGEMGERWDDSRGLRRTTLLVEGVSRNQPAGMWKP